jgi:hypothetical protein
MIAIAMTAGSAHADNNRVVMQLQIQLLSVALGEPLRLTVVLKNVGGDSILLLVRDANFVVEVQSGKLQTITMPRYTRRRVPFRDDEVPLRPGGAFSRELPVALNDLRATLGEGWIGVPGTYRIRVRYDSEGSVQDPSPLAWQGSATLNWEDVCVRATTDGEKTRHLHEMAKCIGETEDCDTTQTAKFFRVVRDERAPDLLLRLLQKRPFDIWLLDAVVFQRRRSDAERLRSLSSSIEDPSIRERYIDAAEKLVRLPERLPHGPTPPTPRPGSRHDVGGDGRELQHLPMV